MRPLTDRERIEVAVPCVLWHGLVVSGCLTPDPSAPADEAATELAQTLAKLEGLLSKASEEPLSDLPPKKRRQLGGRVLRVSTEASEDLNEQPAIKVALALYYFTKALLDAEVLVLWEGSAMGEAMEILFPTFEHGFSRAAQDASAQKQARRLLALLQRNGFYQSFGLAA